MQECEAAVAIVRARRPEDSVLLMRRTEREGDPWSGHWSFPGGRRELSDPDALATAARELYEECGVRVDETQLETALPAEVARRRTGRFLRVAPFVFRIDSQIPTVLDTSEAVEAQWVRVARLRDPAEHRLLPVPGMPAGMLFPAIAFDHIPLWGFTYRLITEWLDLLPVNRAGTGRNTVERIALFLEQAGLRLTRDPGRCEVRVEGAWPVAELIRFLGFANGEIPLVNVVEVSEQLVRIVGLDFAEWTIRAA